MPIVYRNDVRHSGAVQKPYINSDPTRRSRKGSGKDLFQAWRDQQARAVPLVGIGQENPNTML